MSLFIDLDLSSTLFEVIVVMSATRAVEVG